MRKYLMKRKFYLITLTNLGIETLVMLAIRTIAKLDSMTT